jgi:hypothetical protein
MNEYSLQPEVLFWWHAAQALSVSILQELLVKV